ncbi:MAG TPA: DNA methyltransferase, partial [Acetobacteraceae bacterium]|nr:DNA methyltransferase [Acetobacteraceae bacterium]
MTERAFRIICGDALSALPTLPERSVHCCVTSPPYYALRDYKVPATHWPAVKYAPMPGLPEVEVPEMVCALGLEPTPEAYVGHLLLILREVRRVLRDDATCWVNLGDSYARDPGKGVKFQAGLSTRLRNRQAEESNCGPPVPVGLKPKDLIGIPWRFAFAMQADGWWLRMDNVWCLSGGTRVYARTQKGEMPMTIKDMVRLDPRTVQLWNGKQWT